MKLWMVCMAVALGLVGVLGQEDESQAMCHQACAAHIFAEYQCVLQNECNDKDPDDEEAIANCFEMCYQPVSQCLAVCQEQHDTIMRECEANCNGFELFCESRCFKKKFLNSPNLPEVNLHNPGIFEGVPLLDSDESAEEEKKRTANWYWEDFEDEDDWW